MKPVVLLAVVLLLLSVPALYAVAVTQGMASEVPVRQGGIDYHGSTNFSYLAELAPSPLYPNGSLGPGGGILFLPLVRSLEVNSTYTLDLNVAATVTVAASYELLVDGTLWNLTLNYSTTDLPPRAVTPTSGLTVQESTTLNMTRTEALLSEIQNATGYTPARYILEFVPSLYLAMAPAGGAVARVVYATPFNLTLENGLIVPGPTNATDSGSNATTVLERAADVPLEQQVALGLAAGILVGAAVAGTVALRELGRERRATDVARRLRRLTAPYQDAIAMTGTPPSTRNVVGLGTWEGLVRVADMLGKPILSYEHPGDGDPTRYFFYVLDGTIQYTYLVPRGDPESIR